MINLGCSGHGRLPQSALDRLRSGDTRTGESEEQIKTDEAGTSASFSSDKTHSDSLWSRWDQFGPDVCSYTLTFLTSDQAVVP